MLLDEIDRRYGPRPGRPMKPAVLVLDNGPLHTSEPTTGALATRPWLTVEWLPRDAPALDAVEPVWRDPKRHHLAHRTFADADHLERAIHEAVEERNRERAHSCDNLRTAA